MDLKRHLWYDHQREKGKLHIVMWISQCLFRILFTWLFSWWYASDFFEKTQQAYQNDELHHHHNWKTGLCHSLTDEHCSLSPHVVASLLQTSSSIKIYLKGRYFFVSFHGNPLQHLMTGNVDNDWKMKHSSDNFVWEEGRKCGLSNHHYDSVERKGGRERNKEWVQFRQELKRCIGSTRFHFVSFPNFPTMFQLVSFVRSSLLSSLHCIRDQKTVHFWGVSSCPIFPS